MKTAIFFLLHYATILHLALGNKIVDTVLEETLANIMDAEKAANPFHDCFIAYKNLSTSALKILVTY